MQALMIVGVYIWGALYTAGVFVAALSLGNHAAMYLALVSAGAAYAAQFAGAIVYDQYNPIMKAWYANVAFTFIAVIAGIAAGVSVIVGA